MLAWKVKLALMTWAAAAAHAEWLPPRLGAEWTRIEPPRAFSPGNLFKYNDGAARTYLDYGFVRLRVARYSKAGARMAVEVFDMGAPRNAFGVYSTMRRPDDHFVNVGDEGVVLDGELDFWNGRCFVRVAPAQAASVADQTAVALGRLVAARLGPRWGRTPGAEWFPGKHLVPHSITYYRRAALGCAALRDAFVAQYARNDRHVRALVARRETAAAARDSLEAARAFILRSGTAGPIQKAGERCWFVGRHRFYGRVAFAAQGGRLSGALGAATDKAALSLVDRLLR